MGSESVATCDAQALSERLLGDTMAANVLLLGFAWQHGLVPIGREAIERALELNGVAVQANKLAFACGRLAAAEPAALDALLGVTEDAPGPSDAAQLDAIVQAARLRLADYQNAALALRYQNFVDQVRAVEKSVLPSGAPLELTRQVALNYAKLLACKDEYEVARLYTNGSLERSLRENFEGDYTVHYHFAPEYLVNSRPDGRPQAKRRFGPSARIGLKLLAGLRGLRGTPLDPFAWSSARKAERALAQEYEQLMTNLLRTLKPSNHATAVRLAALPATVRGFGSVRVRSVAAMRAQAKEIEAEVVA